MEFSLVSMVERRKADIPVRQRQQQTPGGCDEHERPGKRKPVLELLP